MYHFHIEEAPALFAGAFYRIGTWLDAGVLSHYCYDDGGGDARGGGDSGGGEKSGGEWNGWCRWMEKRQFCCKHLLGRVKSKNRERRRRF